MSDIKGRTTSIRFTSRVSVKHKDTFFTLEACEERFIPDVEGVDIEAERNDLWETLNKQVDTQVEGILAS